jgi:uncharacterized protein (TIGR03086 family)
MRTIEILAADAAATRGSAELVARLAVSDLARPTPCAEWDLQALLEHMITQHRGFAAAAAGRGGDLAVWQQVPLADPIGAYPAAAEEVLAAFATAFAPFLAVTSAPTSASTPTSAGAPAGDGGPEPLFVLPEIARAPSFPGRVAVSFHLVDYVVHGWDVARTVGLPYAPPPFVLEAALPVARAVPDGPDRVAFASGLAVASDAGMLDEILLRLGRDPQWQPPAGELGTR